MKKLFSLLLNVMLIATLPTMCLQANPPANDPPVITVSGNTSICYGSSTTLTASGAATYLWTTALPLDGISSASIAVGLHKLKTSYSGFALQLRRQTDNATMDFGFSGNDLDLAAISTFLNGSNGFCSVLYDQSGNGNNLTQPNAANQPLFVANGQNGKPVLRCTISHFMKNPTNFNGPYSVVYAAKGITIVPNPSTSSFKLTVRSVSKLNVQVRLLDLSGRQLKNMNIRSNQTIEFGNDLNAGIYLVEIQQGDERRTERIIKL